MKLIIESKKYFKKYNHNYAITQSDYHKNNYVSQISLQTVDLINNNSIQLVKFMLIGLSGVVLTSRAVVWAAEGIALHFAVSEIVIGATIVALGTSLPEISTCITAALKGEGEIAVGNILGADVLNVLWIIGVASVVKPIAVDLDIINFAFPYMILIVIVMLVCLHIGCRLSKVKGIILFVFYLVYLGLTLKLFT